MPDVYLLRHGEPVGCGDGRFLGQRNQDLTPTGREQAAAWQPVLAGIPLALAVASDLIRCQRTAKLALAGHPAPLRSDPRLREISLGAWEGLTVPEVEERFPGRYAARLKRMDTAVPEGGESFRQVAARAEAALTEHALEAHKAGGPLLVVAHSGVARSLTCRALGLPLRSLLRVELGYARCIVFDFDEKRAKLRGVRALNLPAQAFA